MQGYELAIETPADRNSRLMVRRKRRRRAVCIKAICAIAAVLVTSVLSAGLTVLFLKRGASADARRVPASGAASLTPCGGHDDLIAAGGRSKSSALDRLFDSLVLDIRLQRIARFSHVAGAALTAVANASRPAPGLAPAVARLHEPRLLAARSLDLDSLAPLPLDPTYLAEMAAHFGAIVSALRQQLSRNPKLQGAVSAVEAAARQTQCLQRDVAALAVPGQDDQPSLVTKGGAKPKKIAPAPEDAALLERPEVRLHVLCRDAAELLRNHEALCAAFVALDARLVLKKATVGKDSLV